jgi:hypothetical protein
MVVQRVPKEKGEIEESESSSEEHKFFVWNMIVSEGVEASSLLDYDSDEESTELPLVCKKVSSLIKQCISFHRLLLGYFASPI